MPVVPPVMVTSAPSGAVPPLVVSRMIVAAFTSTASEMRMAVPGVTMSAESTVVAPEPSMNTPTPSVEVPCTVSFPVSRTLPPPLFTRLSRLYAVVSPTVMVPLNPVSPKVTESNPAESTLIEAWFTFMPG